MSCVADLARAYAAALDNRQDDASPLPMQYAEFAAWQRVREAAGALDDDIAYWTRQLAGAPNAIDLGADRPLRSAQTFQGGVLHRDIEPDLMQRLAAVATENEATRFTAGLSAWAAWLHERTGEDDIVVATVVAGRTRVEFEPLIGAFVNTVAIRLNAGGGCTFGDLVRQARRTTIAAVRHQHAPLERLLERLRPVRGAQSAAAHDLTAGAVRTPIAQVAFVQPAERRLTPMPGLQIERLVVDAPGAKTDLSLSLDGRGGRWVASLEYSADRFSRAAAERAADDFIRFFRSVMKSSAAIGPARTLPLTPAQTRVWLDQQRSPGVPLYNVATAVDMDGLVDGDAFARAFARLVARTDALRLECSTMAGVPRQRVVDSIRGDTERVDLSDLGEASRAAWIRTEASRPFLPGQPLFRSILLRRARGSSTWLFIQHHLITDGSSVRLLCDRLSHLYEAERRSCADDVEAGESFTDYVASLRESDGAGDAWWLERFEDVEPPRFFGVRPQKASTSVTRTRRVFTPEAVERFRAAAGTLPGVPATQAAFLLCGAALVALLHRMTGETTIAFGVPMHQRAHRRHRGVVGLLMDVVPVAVECRGTDTIDDLVSRLGLALRATLRRAGSAPPQSVRERACDVLLNVQTTALDTFCGHRAEIDWIHSGHERESLTVQFHDLGARMGVDVDTLDDAFDGRQRAQTVERLIRVLDQCVGDRAVRVGDLRIADDRERADAIAAAIGPVRRDAYAHDVVERVLATARRQPTAIAIESGDRRTTYGELADHVLRIAGGLVRKGVGGGELVGVCLERSPAFVEAVLGVMAAGAAYLPLDAAAPHERTAACLANAGARLAIVADRSHAGAEVWRLRRRSPVFAGHRRGRGANR